MSGIAAKDLTEEQLEAAGGFLDLVSETGPDEEMVLVEREALLILLAWYGALRFQDATLGNGTLNEPGTFQPIRYH